MCNRHVAHMIADYEAARGESDGEEAGHDEQTAPSDSVEESSDWNGILRTLLS